MTFVIFRGRILIIGNSERLPQNTDRNNSGPNGSVKDLSNGLKFCLEDKLFQNLPLNNNSITFL